MENTIFEIKEHYTADEIGLIYVPLTKIMACVCDTNKHWLPKEETA